MDKIDISKLKIPEVNMSEYKDVVTLVSNISNQVDKELEDGIYSYCVQYGITVDKDRLLEVLKNDRLSYADGWRAGYAAALEEERQRRKSYRPKLLPCKYCGGRRTRYLGNSIGQCRKCIKCGHKGPIGLSENEARRLWNEEMDKDNMYWVKF